MKIIIINHTLIMKYLIYQMMIMKKNSNIEDLIIKDIKLTEKKYSSFSYNLEDENDIQENKIDDKDIDDYKCPSDKNIKNERGLFKYLYLSNKELLKIF